MLKILLGRLQDKLRRSRIKNENVTVFKHEELGEVRTIGDNENPLFCLSDVCKILGLTGAEKVANAIKKGVWVPRIKFGSSSR